MRLRFYRRGTVVFNPTWAHWVRGVRVPYVRRWGKPVKRAWARYAMRRRCVIGSTRFGGGKPPSYYLYETRRPLRVVGEGK